MCLIFAIIAILIQMLVSGTITAAEGVKGGRELITAVKKCGGIG
jgi:hypothetical protein